MKHLLPLAVMAASLFAYSQTKDHPDGEIKGIVTDQSGSPVPAVTVYAVPQFVTLDGITPRSVKTDGNGQFDFRGGLQLGAYKLYSRKDKDSYPDPFDTFYADSKAETPTIDLTEANPSATATVKLEKAGAIEGRVLDTANGNAVAAASVMFLDNDGNGHEVSASADGKYRALLPTGKDLIVTVNVTRQPWDHMQCPVAPLRLEAGDEIYLDLLVSKQKPPTKPTKFRIAKPLTSLGFSRTGLGRVETCIALIMSHETVMDEPSADLARINQISEEERACSQF